MFLVKFDNLFVRWEKISCVVLFAKKNTYLETKNAVLNAILILHVT